MKFKKGILAALFGGLLGCKAPSNLQTVQHVDAEKYMGTWYDVASFPQRFQKNCKCTTAKYTLNEDNTIHVENACIDKKSGKQKGITGKAFVADEQNNAKLKVQFFWPIKADYWIIDLAPDYSWAVVSEPNKEYLWILSRTPNLKDIPYDAITKKLADQGFDINRLQKTVHDCTD